jgi:hypothetical protein
VKRSRADTQAEETEERSACRLETRQKGADERLVEDVELSHVALERRQVARSDRVEGANLEHRTCVVDRRRPAGELGVSKRV